MYFYPTDQTEISKIISNLKTNKSPGDDCISNKLLKECSPILSPIISHVVNTIIISGKYPDVLKLGKVIPYIKKVILMILQTTDQ
jgi:hypothetical protein